MRINKLRFGILAAGLGIAISMTSGTAAAAEEVPVAEEILTDGEQTATEESVSEEPTDEDQQDSSPTAPQPHIIINQIYGTGNKKHAIIIVGLFC